MATRTPGAPAGAEGFRQFLRNLLALLSDDNQSIVTYAARALREYDTEEVRAGLLDRVSSCPDACVGEMVATLESLHEDSADELFHLLSRSPSAQVRAASVDRLGRRLPASDAQKVWELLETETDPHVSASLLSLLGTMRPELGGRQLARYLESEDVRVRANALELLGRLSGPLEASLIEPLLTDQAPRVRGVAMRLLWPERQEALWKSLQEELTSHDTARELAAVYLLGQVPGPPEAALALVERLKNPALQVRILASRSLLTCPGPVDSAALCALYMEESNPAVRQNLMEYCRRAGPTVALTTFAKLLENRTLYPETRATAARALGDLAHPDAIPLLLTTLDDPDPRVRANSVEALSRCPYEGMIDILLPRLEDPNPRVQATTALAVWRLGGRETVDLLLKMLRSNDPKKQASAAFALGEIGSGELVAPLNQLLEDLSSAVVTTEAQRQVQKTVMRALAKIRGL